jgi:hypothetical protein
MGLDSLAQKPPRGTPAARVILVALGVLATGCAPRPLLERAVRARGGPLRSFVRVSEADVQAGFPGAWQWRMAFLAPDRYAWSIVTTTGMDHYIFDGRAVHAFVGGREVASNAARDAPLRLQARFIAITSLDLAAGATVVPLAPADRPPGVDEAVSVTMPDDGTRYRLGFDDRGLLVWATGPFDVPQAGRGELTARYDDYRRVQGLLLPFRITYALGPRPLAVEHVTHACPNDPALTPASFAAPERLPACDTP